MKEPILIYDLQGLPHNAGITGGEVVKFYKEEKIVLWDSSGEGRAPVEPKILNLTEGTQMKTLDLAKVENEEILKQIINKVKE